MMSSWSLEQKWAFKLILHLVIWVVIVTVAITSTQRRASEYYSARETLIREYEAKIKDKEQENKTLIALNENLVHQTDSLKKVKQTITIIYDEKINSIYDATAINHANWLDSVTKKLSSSSIK